MRLRRLASILAALAPVVLAFVISFVFFAITGFDVGEVTSGIYDGSLGGTSALKASFRWGLPLVLIALGVLVSLRAGEFNIGGQGQFIVAGIAAMWIGLEWSAPTWVTIVVAFGAAVLAGVLWSMIAGVLKVFLKADEVITTLMLNLIAIQLLIWVATGPLKDTTTSGDAASTPRLEPDLRLSDGTGFSLELAVILAVAVVGMWFFADRTTTGLRMSFVGSNVTAAAWQGVAVTRVRLVAYAVAGALAGLAGAVEAFGPAGRIATGSNATLGFTAIVVASVGALRVGGSVIAGFFFGGLQAAVLFLPIVSDLPISGVRIIEGLVALLITARLIDLARIRRRSKSALPTPNEPARPPATVTERGKN